MKIPLWAKVTGGIPLWVKVTGGIALAVVCLVAADYVAGFLFLLINKRNPLGTHLGTYFQYWYYYHGDIAQAKHLKAALAIAVVACVITPLFVVLHLLSGPVRSLYGEARFANAGEIRRAGLLGNAGIIVGKYAGKFLLFAGQQFVILAAPTRSGKGVGFVIPNLLTWPDSVVNFDPKQENYEKTAGFRQKYGQKVYLFNPFAEDRRTSRYNPLAYISDNPDFREGDVLAIGSILYPQGADRDQFWNDQARNLFLGLTLYLCETPELPRTIGEVYRQSSGKGKSLKNHLLEIIEERENADRPLSDACVDALQRFINTSENTMANIVASFNAPLLHWSNPIVDAATSANDFDLRDLRRERMSIYVGITPDYLDQASMLVNLFFSQLVNLNTKELPEKNKALKYQVLLLMDEFTSIGRIAIIAKAIAYMAGYGLRLATVIQSVGQLESTYPKESRNLITNHALQILYTPREQKDASEYSEMLGYLTDRTPGRSRSNPRGMFGRGNMTESISNSQQKRALLLPQELREMSLEKEIVMLENIKPVMADKIRWYADPVLKARLVKAPDVPLLDMDQYRAKLENRTRPATLDDVKEDGTIDLERFQYNANCIPPADSSDSDPEKTPNEEKTIALVLGAMDNICVGMAGATTMQQPELPGIEPSMAFNVEIINRPAVDLTAFDEENP